MTTIGLTTRDVARELARRYSTMTHDELDVLESILVPMKFQKGEIILMNDGQTTLNITSLQMFTPGLKVTLSKRELKPGETAKLKITGIAKELKRARTKPRVLMITNDPDKPKVVISVNIK